MVLAAGPAGGAQWLRVIAAARRLAMPYDEAQALWLASRYGASEDLARAEAEAAREIFARLGCAWHLAQLPAPTSPVAAG